MKGEEKIVCDFCGSDNYTLYAKQTDIIHRTTKRYFSVVKCSECGLIYTNPRPTEESISKYYSSNYNFHSNNGLFKKFIKFVFKILSKNFFVRAISTLLPKRLNLLFISFLKPKISDPVIEYIDKNLIKKKNLRFIDIGCGSGFNANFWGKQSSLIKLSKIIKVIGVEISDHARQNLMENDIESYKNIYEIGKKNNYDIIRLNWSLEHVHYPSKYFEFISLNLTQNGIAIICVPNNDGMIYKLNRSCLELPIHLYHFNLEILTKFAEKYNLYIHDHKSFSYPSMYTFAEQLNLIPSKYKFREMNLNLAHNFMKMHEIIDDNNLGNDLMVILKKKSKTL